jgi:hypothetical protein
MPALGAVGAFGWWCSRIGSDLNFWRFSQEVDTESTYFSNLKQGCEVTKMASKARVNFISPMKQKAFM